MQVQYRYKKFINKYNIGLYRDNTGTIDVQWRYNIGTKHVFNTWLQCQYVPDIKVISVLQGIQHRNRWSPDTNMLPHPCRVAGIIATLVTLERYLRNSWLSSWLYPLKRGANLQQACQDFLGTKVIGQQLSSGHHTTILPYHNTTTPPLHHTITPHHNTVVSGPI